jgi:hypothetical protein
MTKKRIPWPAIDVKMNETRFLRMIVRCFHEFGWRWVSRQVNSQFNNARTPDACRRKWRRMQG